MVVTVDGGGGETMSSNAEHAPRVETANTATVDATTARPLQPLFIEIISSVVSAPVTVRRFLGFSAVHIFEAHDGPFVPGARY